jgi:cytochrome c oxidase assembly factor 7
MPLGSSAGVGAGTDLKEAGEVKEYIENLGIEYRFGCYHEKNPSSCHLLADYWEAIKKDFTKAYKTYETNCIDLEHGHSCHKAAGYRVFGKGCTKNIDLAFGFFQKGCDLGYHSSCLSAGLIEMANEKTSDFKRTVAPDRKNGLELFKKGCDEGNIAESCYRYGAAFINGTPNGCLKDMNEAFKYCLKACELGSFAGCTNVSLMYRKGDGVEKNEELAKEYGAVAKEMLDELKQAQESFKTGPGTDPQQQ